MGQIRWEFYASGTVVTGFATSLPASRGTGQGPGPGSEDAAVHVATAAAAVTARPAAAADSTTAVRADAHRTGTAAVSILPALSRRVGAATAALAAAASAAGRSGRARAAHPDAGALAPEAGVVAAIGVRPTRDGVAGAATARGAQQAPAAVAIDGASPATEVAAGIRGAGTRAVAAQPRATLGVARTDPIVPMPAADAVVAGPDATVRGSATTLAGPDTTAGREGAAPESTAAVRVPEAAVGARRHHFTGARAHPALAATAAAFVIRAHAHATGLQQSCRFTPRVHGTPGQH